MGFSMLRIAAGHWISAILATILSSASATAATGAASMADVIVAQAIADQLTTPQLSDSLRHELLSAKDANDRDYFKVAAIQWKSAATIKAVGDRLSVRDSKGIEVATIARHPNDPNQFTINDRPWKLPARGSIVQSLRKHLNEPFEPKKWQAAIFDFLDSQVGVANAAPSTEAEGIKMGIVACYLYGTRTGSGEIYQSPTAALDVDGLGKPFVRVDLLKFWNPPTVLCGDQSATGRIDVKNHAFDFESRKDGRLFLRGFNPTRIFEVISQTDSRDFGDALNALKDLRANPEITSPGAKEKMVDTIVSDLQYICKKKWMRNVREFVSVCELMDDHMSRVDGMSELVKKSFGNLVRGFERLNRMTIQSSQTTIQECADSTCTVPKGKPDTTLNRWYDFPRPVEADIAIGFLTKSSQPQSAPIDYACSDRRCDTMNVLKPEKLSAEDRTRAFDLKVAAEFAIQAERSAELATIQRLRPLYACCQSEDCRATALRRDLELRTAPAAAGSSTKR